MDIELEKLKKLEHALHDAIDILRDWQVEEVKPEEEKYIVYLARENDGSCYLSACIDDYWESVQKEFGAKTKLFIGAHDEVSTWFELRQKFAEVIKAWEDGKTIQYYSSVDKTWDEVLYGKPLWNPADKYRIKPGEKDEVNPTQETNRKLCLRHRLHRPYESSAEMICDFIDRFKVNCPSYCEPLIWVKGKETDNRYLVFAFCENGIEFNDDEPLEFEQLFDCYTYLDGSPVGMEVKE